MVNFDKAATTKPSTVVLDAIQPYLTDIYGNPNSNHALGRQARKAIEHARSDVADLLRCDVKNIYFTNSVTTANNIAIHGYMKNHSSVHILCSAVEHIDIIECVQSYNYSIIPVDSDGQVDISIFKQLCAAQPADSLIIVQYVNNETGCTQPIQELAQIAHEYHHVFLCDVTQAVGYERINIGLLDVDILTFGAHKIGGIRGAAVLYSSVSLSQIICGHQERGLIGGTEDTAAIVGLSVALKDISCKNISYMRSLTDYFKRKLLQHIPCAHINAVACQSPHIVNVRFDGCEGNTIVTMLDSMNIYASTGSACNSRMLKKSYVLDAMGIKEPEIYECVRFSFDYNNTKDEADFVIDKLEYITKFLYGLQEKYDGL